MKQYLEQRRWWKYHFGV